MLITVHKHSQSVRVDRAMHCSSEVLCKVVYLRTSSDYIHNSSEKICNYVDVPPCNSWLLLN